MFGVNVLNDLLVSYVFKGVPVKLPGRYTDVKLLGNGGQGFTLRAKDKDGTDVVIKVLVKSFESFSVAKHSLREFMLLNVVSHRRSVRLLNAFTQATSADSFEKFYMVMPYVGKTLSERIYKSEEKLTRQDILRIMNDILNALSYFHDNGIIHKDITPGNIGVDPDGNATLLDLGLSLVITDSTMSQNFGTLNYRAPEYLVGRGHYNTKKMINRRRFFKAKGVEESWPVIVRELGSPGRKFTETIPLTSRQYIEGFKFEPRPWEDLIPDTRFGENEDEKIVLRIVRNIISKMLVIDPNERWNAKQLLNEFYSNDLWDEEDDIIGEQLANNDLKNEYRMAKTIGDIRTLLYRKIKEYEVAHDVYGIGDLARAGVLMLVSGVILSILYHRFSRTTATPNRTKTKDRYLDYLKTFLVDSMRNSFAAALVASWFAV